MSAIVMPEVDARVIARRESIVAGLAAIVGDDAVIAERGRAPRLRDRCAHRLPGGAARRRPAGFDRGGRRGAEISRPRRASRSSPAAPEPRSPAGRCPRRMRVVLGLARLNRILAVDYDNRVATVEAGVTNINISNAVAHKGFFYAPDPSSQLACTIAGNVAMNSGGAHCLKYGVTTNNVLGVKMVLIDGTVLDHRRRPSRRAGLRSSRPGRRVRGPARRRHRGDGAHPARRRRRPADADGLLQRRGRRRLRRRHHRLGHHAGGDRIHGRPGDQGLRGASPMPAIRSTSRRMLIVEVEGSEAEIADLIRRIGKVAEALRPAGRAGVEVGSRERRHLEGPQGRLRRHGPDRRLFVHGRRHPHRPSAGGAHPRRRDLRRPRPCRRQHLPCRRRQPAPAHPLRRQQARRHREGRSCRRRRAQALRRGRRLPDRRARRRHREARPDDRAVLRRRSRPADAGEERLRSRLAAQPGQGLPAGGAAGAAAAAAPPSLRPDTPRRRGAPGGHHRFFPSISFTSTAARSKSSNRRAFTPILGLSKSALPEDQSGNSE